VSDDGTSTYFGAQSITQAVATDWQPAGTGNPWNELTVPDLNARLF
jgi:hypothetical protein